MYIYRNFVSFTSIVYSTTSFFKFPNILHYKIWLFCITFKKWIKSIKCCKLSQILKNLNFVKIYLFQSSFHDFYQKSFLLISFLSDADECMGHCYKTFYGRKLRYNKQEGFVLGKPFQSGLMFASKAGAYRSEAALRRSTLG